MPVFFIHVEDGPQFIEDLDGAEFGTLDHAKDCARQAAFEIVSDRIRGSRPPIGSKFVIADKNGRVVLVIPFQDALNLPH